MNNNPAAWAQAFDKLQSEQQLALQHVADQVLQTIRDEHLKTRREVAARDALTAQREAEKTQHKMLLDALFLPEYRSRREQVSEAHANTFQWIWELDHTQPLLPAAWDSFPKWLQEEGYIYWICGKAGSGKSTLMSYVLESLETRSLLDSRVTVSQTVILDCIFWKPGSHLQRSILGMLRSILYQAWNAFPCITLTIAQGLPEYDS